MLEHRQLADIADVCVCAGVRNANACILDIYCTCNDCGAVVHLDCCDCCCSDDGSTA